MKKFMLTVGVLLLILLVLISCAPDPAVLFDNFTDDLDIEARFNDYVTEVSKGKGSDLTVNGINALIADLNTMTLDNEDAKKINNEFIRSCEILKDAVKTDTQNNLSEARKVFQDAIKKENDFTKRN